MNLYIKNEIRNSTQNGKGQKQYLDQLEISNFVNKSKGSME